MTNASIHYDKMVTALETIAELQNDKIEHASPYLVLALLIIKVDIARAVLADIKESTS